MPLVEGINDDGVIFGALKAGPFNNAHEERILKE